MQIPSKTTVYGDSMLTSQNGALLLKTEKVNACKVAVFTGIETNLQGCKWASLY